MMNKKDWHEYQEAVRVAKEEYEHYYKTHQACPSCGSDNITSTLLGYSPVPGFKFKDKNGSWCENCGWRGIYDDLVEKEQNE